MLVLTDLASGSSAFDPMGIDAVGIAARPPARGGVPGTSTPSTYTSHVNRRCKWTRMTAESAEYWERKWSRKVPGSRAGKNTSVPSLSCMTPGYLEHPVCSLHMSDSGNMEEDVRHVELSAGFISRVIVIVPRLREHTSLSIDSMLQGSDIDAGGTWT